MTAVVAIPTREHGAWPRAWRYFSATRPGWTRVISPTDDGRWLAAIMAPDWKPGGPAGRMFAAAGDSTGEALQAACRKADDADAARAFAQ